MKGLAALIRLHNWELDAKRRELADIEREQDALHDRIRRFEGQVIEEQSFAKDSESGMFAFVGYMRGVDQRRKQFQSEVVAMHERIEAKREEVAEAYQELKRYEITQAEILKREKLEADRRLQGELDEISLNQHRRADG
jgi:flagellar export protein FliJ